jgi:hypothetical protein
MSRPVIKLGYASPRREDPEALETKPNLLGMILIMIGITLLTLFGMAAMTIFVIEVVF